MPKDPELSLETDCGRPDNLVAEPTFFRGRAVPERSLLVVEGDESPALISITPYTEREGGAVVLRGRRFGGAPGSVVEGSNGPTNALYFEVDCTPRCGDRDCGDDGCGDVCGTCAPGLECSKVFVCVPAE